MKIKFFLPVFLLGLSVQAQDGIAELLSAGIADAEQFSQDYFSPAAEGIMYGLSNGWYNTAEAKDLGGFELSIIGNASFVKDEYKSFTLNVADYTYLRFQDPSKQTGQVATVLGENDPEVVMIIEYENDLGISQQAEITLPQGIGASGVNVLPTAFLQLGVGVFEGTEVKVRYLPKIDQDGVGLQLFGGAIQHELTSWLPGAKMLPVSIGVLAGYTHLNAKYNLTGKTDLDGENQRIKTEVNSLVFSAIVSTKLPVINFYGGLGYVTGNSQTDLLGTYKVQTGILGSNVIVTDPLSVENKVSGFKATLGTRLKVGFFSLHADYSFQKFNNLTVGIGVVF